MKKYWKDRWIKALRSGEYEQCGGQLKVTRDDKAYFCCLGVLCDLTKNRAGIKEDWEDDGGKRVPSFMGKSGSLPEEVCKLTGLLEEEDEEGFRYPKWDGEYIGSKKEERSLAEDNDSGKSFKQIANIIEKRF